MLKQLMEHNTPLPEQSNGNKLYAKNAKLSINTAYCGKSQLSVNNDSHRSISISSEKINSSRVYKATKTS